MLDVVRVLDLHVDAPLGVIVVVALAIADLQAPTAKSQMDVRRLMATVVLFRRLT